MAQSSFTSSLPARPRSTRSTRSVLWTVVGCLISAVFVYLALRKISLDELRASFVDASYGWLIPCLLLTGLVGWLRAVRWRTLFLYPERFTPRVSLATTALGLGANVVMPARTGDLPRIVAASRASGLPATEVTATVVIERLLDLWVISVLGVVLWPILPDRPWIHVMVAICLAIVVAFAAFVVVAALLRDRLASAVLRTLRRLPFFDDDRASSVRVALGCGTAILRRPRRLGAAIGTSALVWAATGLSVWALMPAFDLDLGASVPWFVLLANTFAVALPASPGAVGVYEASIQAALVAAGASSSAGLSFAIVLHAMNVFPVLVAAAAAAVWLRRVGAR